MQQEDGNCSHATEQSIGIEQGEEIASEHHLVVNRHAARKVCKGGAEQQGGEEGTDCDHPIEAIAPGGICILGAIFKGNTADDQTNQQKEQGEIEAAEHGGIPMRESREGRTTGSEQPYFIAIPGGTDGVDDGASFFIFFAEERQEHSDAEIESFKEEEADPQYGDQDKPKDLEKFVRHIEPPG